MSLLLLSAAGPLSTALTGLLSHFIAKQAAEKSINHDRKRNGWSGRHD